MVVRQLRGHNARRQVVAIPLDVPKVVDGVGRCRKSVSEGRSNAAHGVTKIILVVNLDRAGRQALTERSVVRRWRNNAIDSHFQVGHTVGQLRSCRLSIGVSQSSADGLPRLLRNQHVRLRERQTNRNRATDVTREHSGGCFAQESAPFRDDKRFRLSSISRRHLTVVDGTINRTIAVQRAFRKLFDLEKRVVLPNGRHDADASYVDLAVLNQTGRVARQSAMYRLATDGRRRTRNVTIQANGR